MGKSIRGIIESNLLDKYIARGKATKAAYTNDIIKLVEDLKNDKIFNSFPGRCHGSFKKFKNRIELNNPEKLRQKLIGYSRKLDTERDLIM